MKRFMWLLVILLIVGAPPFTTICFAEEDEYGETVTFSGPENESASDLDAQELAEPSPDDPDSEELAEPSPDDPDSEEQPVAEEKTYTCPECSFSLDYAGDCPSCNVALVEDVEEATPKPVKRRRYSTPTSSTANWGCGSTGTY